MIKDVRRFRNKIKHTTILTDNIFKGIDNYYHYLYKIVNNINNHYYIGVHSCKNIDNDKYAGSGYALAEAYKLYGIENFTKNILEFFYTEKEMYDKESVIVTDSVVNDHNSYNLCCGGKGAMTNHLPVYNPITGESCIMSKDDIRYINGEFISTSTGARNANYGLHKTNEFKQKMSQIMKGKLSGSNSPYFGTHRSKDICDKIKQSKKGKICVNKNNINKYINKDELQIFLDDGYILGPTKQSVISALEARKKVKCQPTKGRCWVTNNINNKLIKPEELDYYISIGYYKGKIQKNKL